MGDFLLASGKKKLKDNSLFLMTVFEHVAAPAIAC
jgi:hypothetical protein